MKKLILILAVILCTLYSSRINAQTVDPCHYSTEGKDFWFGFMQNRLNGAEHYLEITITSRFEANFTITYGSPEKLYCTGKVDANTSLPVTIASSITQSDGSETTSLKIEPNGSETIENLGIHLVTDNPVNVYALNYRTQSSDVAVIYPTNALGKEYFAMCYTPHVLSGRETNSEFLIVATDDNTNVNITPSKDTNSGHNAKTPFKITLNKGHIYQVQSTSSDLTGSYVTSDKPVAFYSGSMATSIPVTGSSYDHLYEQMSPTSTWGKEFYAVPLKLRSKDTYRVLAAENGTIVTIGSNSPRTLNQGEWYEFELSSSQASRITSTKKILVAQFCRSQTVDDASGLGDPFMIMLSPISQKINDVNFVAYKSKLIQNTFFVNVVARTSDVGDIILDGTGIGSYFSEFSKTEYSYAQIPITKGTHRLWTAKANQGFLAFVYGFGDAKTESYGYGVGFNLNVQLDIGGTFVTTDTLMLCQGKDVKLDAGSYFDSYLWNTDETTSFITVSKEKWYKVTASTAMGCIKTDSVYIKISDPKIDLGKDRGSCGPGLITLDAGKGFKSYKWQDGSTDQTYKVMTTGDYSVTGINLFDCQASDTVHIDVYQVPEVKIVGDSHLCGVLTSELKVNIANVDTALWNYPSAGKWTSSSSDLTFENIKPDGVTLKAKKSGLYTVNYVLTTKEGKEGCQDSDSFQVAFYDIPESTFTVESPESTDKCSTYERIVKYTGKNGSSAKFNWDFGGLMVLETIAPNQFKISIGANKPNRTISLIVEENGCQSPVTAIPIGVNPTFSFGADKVHGCDALCVQFNSKVTIMDQVSYHWTFGDGTESDLPNPKHCYQNTGEYDVSLMVTNAIDGCRNGSVEEKMIKIYKTPKAEISADPNFCYQDTVNFSYLNANELSHSKWFAKGNKLLSADNAQATYLLTNEVSQVGFLVEENGCSCDTLKVQVKRKPNFDFKASEPDICLPFPATLYATSTDADLLFRWKVDSLQNVEGDSLIHLFNKPGVYSVTLNAYSYLTGCSDDLTRENFIQVNPLPVPAFNQNYEIATDEHSEISFQNQSEGAVSYFWDFGDGTISDEVSPKHKYTKVGDYRVIMKAVTDFGCSDTIGSKVKIIPFSFYTPNAFRPDSNIPENQVFLPIREGIDPNKYQLAIFNRVGSTVFESKNPETGWDGNLSNGTKAESGVYVWVVKYDDVQGYAHVHKGTVMLVR